MKVETQRKLLGGILVLGALGLGVDRLFFASKPAVTDEMDNYAVDTTIGAAAAAVTPVATLTTTGEKLARAAATVLPAGTTDRDAFAVTAVAPKPKQPVDDLAITFAAKHRLTAVVVKPGNRGGALVDGKLVTVGQTVGGLRLAAVAADSATFTTGSDTVTLRMPMAGATIASVQ